MNWMKMVGVDFLVVKNNDYLRVLDLAEKQYKVLIQKQAQIFSTTREGQ